MADERHVIRQPRGIGRLRDRVGYGSLVGRASALATMARAIPSRVRNLVGPTVSGVSVVAPLERLGKATQQTADATRRLLASPFVGARSVAVSVDSDAVHLLQYAGNRVIGWATLPLEPRIVRAGVVIDPSGLASLLDNAFRRLRLPRRQVLGVISGLHSAAAVVDLPRVAASDLEEIVLDEGSRALGLSPDNCYFFWQIVDQRWRRHLRAFVLAVPREPMLALLEAFHEARLRPIAFDLKPLALARAVNQRDAIVVNLERDSLDLAIVVDDVPVFVRSLALAESRFDREAAQERLIEEVVRALAAHEDANPTNPLDPGTAIFVSGAAASGIAFAERLRARTGHPIGRPVPSLRCPANFPLSEQLANLGLAMKEQ